MKSPLLLALALLFAASSGDARTLVVANKSADTVSLIDLASGREVATLPTGKAPHEVAISADGRRAAITNYGSREAPGSSLTLLDLAGRRVEKTIDLGEHRRPHGVVWSADGRGLWVTAEGSKALLEVDVAEGKVRRALPTAMEVSHMVAVTAAGDRAFVANIRSGNVTALDLASGQVLAQIATGDGAEGIGVDPGGEELWVSNRAVDTLTVLGARDLARRAELPAPGFPIRLAFTPDAARVLVSAAKSGRLLVFDRRERRAVGEVAFAEKAAGGEGRLMTGFGDSPVPIGVVVDATGRFAYVAMSNADRIAEIDLARLAVVRTLTAGREPDGMGFSSLDSSGAVAGAR